MIDIYFCIIKVKSIQICTDMSDFYTKQ